MFTCSSQFNSYECLHERNIAMLIREPELGYNTENKRLPRGGRARQLQQEETLYDGSYTNGHVTNHTLVANTALASSRKRREAEEEVPAQVTFYIFQILKLYF